MAVLQKIGVLSVAKIQALIMAFFGLIIGLLIAVFSSLFSAVGGMGGFYGLGIMAVIVIPVMYGIIGFVTGIIFAFLYNLIAGWVGGIEFEVKK